MSPIAVPLLTWSLLYRVANINFGRVQATGDLSIGRARAIAKRESELAREPITMALRHGLPVRSMQSLQDIADHLEERNGGRLVIYEYLKGWADLQGIPTFPEHEARARYLKIFAHDAAINGLLPYDNYDNWTLEDLIPLARSIQQ